MNTTDNRIPHCEGPSPRYPDALRTITRAQLDDMAGKYLGTLQDLQRRWKHYEKDLGRLLRSLGT